MINKINGIEKKLNGNMEDLKKDMEGLKEGGTKSLQERHHNAEKVVEETHDENKNNVNHDFIDSNVGLKTHDIPKYKYEEILFSKSLIQFFSHFFFVVRIQSIWVQLYSLHI